jgi:acetyltransferase-like isoleucine patch superfamily enzyme
MSVISRFLRRNRDRLERHWHSRNIPGAHALRRQLINYVRRYGFEIGDYSYATTVPTIRRFEGNGRLTVGRYCSLAPGIEFILGGVHNMTRVTTHPIAIGLEATEPPKRSGDIVIGSDVWIATGVTILPGITIGDGAVIGARSVVTKDVAPYDFVAGNPARKIRSRFDEETVRQLLELRWWDLPAEALRPLVPLMRADRIKDFIRECGKLRRQADAAADTVAELSTPQFHTAAWIKP